MILRCIGNDVFEVWADTGTQSALRKSGIESGKTFHGSSSNDAGYSSKKARSRTTRAKKGIKLIAVNDQYARTKPQIRTRP